MWLLLVAVCKQIVLTRTLAYWLITCDSQIGNSNVNLNIGQAAQFFTDEDIQLGF